MAVPSTDMGGSIDGGSPISGPPHMVFFLQLQLMFSPETWVFQSNFLSQATPWRSTARAWRDTLRSRLSILGESSRKIYHMVIMVKKDSRDGSSENRLIMIV